MNALPRAVSPPAVINASVRRSAAQGPVDPLLEELVRGAVAIGVVLLVLLPAARGYHAQFGWLPLWLLGMPLSAWWALHGFRLPAGAPKAVAPTSARWTRSVPQARPRARPRQSESLPRAA